MDVKKFQKIVVDVFEDIKGCDIEVINIIKFIVMFDCIIVVSGDFNCQVKLFVCSVYDKVKEVGGEVVSMEGEDSGEWVLVDFGSIVVYVM